MINKKVISFKIKTYPPKNVTAKELMEELNQSGPLLSEETIQNIKAFGIPSTKSRIQEAFSNGSLEKFLRQIEKQEAVKRDNPSGINSRGEYNKKSLIKLANILSSGEQSINIKYPDYPLSNLSEEPDADEIKRLIRSNMSAPSEFRHPQPTKQNIEDVFYALAFLTGALKDFEEDLPGTWTPKVIDLKVFAKNQGGLVVSRKGQIDDDINTLLEEGGYIHEGRVNIDKIIRKEVSYDTRVPSLEDQFRSSLETFIHQKYPGPFNNVSEIVYKLLLKAIICGLIQTKTEDMMTHDGHRNEFEKIERLKKLISRARVSQYDNAVENYIKAAQNRYGQDRFEYAFWTEISLGYNITE
ncbi:hypothetical protein A2526_05435 [candidate division WOR-1 bacterium RIFOXYD2_FULL_36_8]|uniref:Uncharacterized protein n=1 Tax=candidate division WOR-1 bacterium RIFOXYB2_FULL_36_35 TaxID=1802578 RepID=A0A1F4S8M5_UNCSA|nr:MAG: hypothetical protein A2230_07370 [candidate division WOR-1 bacterium RIFOXYA2_FULL_36_21]OGC16805.1 MAG: hypothetical protein A2290_07970 [candidate division WOR-1 bacterium RIFOXYB2_FULL_36_35]OGC19820.1 MAG: hypothetical protein A2282_01120 [candidate division WOR-1 bacterium RIFOXYA12_FULL_36_13]OGC37311.1 MAG: hypothetical protein A2526_05435 [candidate division WOR-1 bacterium RIFOXYD2_FULL_36_8]